MQSRLIANLQEEAATGSRINRASDDPAAAFQVMSLQAQVQGIDDCNKNLASVSDDLAVNSSTLQQMTTTLTSAQQLLSQAASGTYQSSQRTVAAQQINSLLEQMVSLANTQNTGRYLYSGQKASTPPFAVTRVAGDITAVNYQGSQNDLSVPVAPGVQMSDLMNGANLFGSSARQAPQFLGTTGAKPGTATSSATGDLWLTVAHTATTYPQAAGVSAGDSSASDTILGDHTLTISTVNKTITLDNGTPVSYDGSESDLAVTNESGDVIHVNMTGATDGTFTVHGDGTLSTDDGQSTTQLTFADNVPVTDPATGKILYVDARNITHTGVEPVSVAGTHDVFEMLINIRDVLENKSNLTASQQSDLLNSQVAALQEVSNVVARSTTAVGAQLSSIENLKTSLSDQQDNANKETASLEDADTAQVATELAQEQTLYQMTLASAAKVLNISIMDYIT